jgi:hypothetical protein
MFLDFCSAFLPPEFLRNHISPDLHKTIRCAHGNGPRKVALREWGD